MCRELVFTVIFFFILQTCRDLCLRFVLGKVLGMERCGYVEGMMLIKFRDGRWKERYIVILADPR